MSRQGRTDRTTLMGARGLTPEGEKLAEEIYARALAIRAIGEGELTIAESIDIAAAQLGVYSEADDQ